MLKFKPLSLLAMLSLAAFSSLVGCSSLKPTIPTILTDSHAATPADVCLVWKTIQYHAKTDAPDTIERIMANNAARASLCHK